MKTIRRSVFETNSSSTHSITIADSGGLKGTLPCNGGVIEVGGGEFGWEHEEYTDALTKLQYLVTRIFEKHVGKDGSVEWNDVNKDWWVKLSRAVEYHTGCILELKIHEKGWYPIGYIDHQSIGVADEVLNATVGKIKRFIFNPRSVIEISNDNDYCRED